MNGCHVDGEHAGGVVSNRAHAAHERIQRPTLFSAAATPDGQVGLAPLAAATSWTSVSLLAPHSKVLKAAHDASNVQLQGLTPAARPSRRATGGQVARNAAEAQQPASCGSTRRNKMAWSSLQLAQRTGAYRCRPPASEGLPAMVQFPAGIHRHRYGSQPRSHTLKLANLFSRVAVQRSTTVGKHASTCSGSCVAWRQLARAGRVGCGGGSSNAAASIEVVPARTQLGM